MGFRRSATLAGSLLLLSATASAVVPSAGPRVSADSLTAMPSSGVTKPLRTTRGFRVGVRTTAAWQRFARTGGWEVAWDPATGVPSRIWGAGIAVPGSNASPAIAEAAARQLLADHLDLLAPGAAVGDFQLVTNRSDGGLRVVGFVQQIGARRVVGGQVSFRFKADRLFVIGSEALPDVKVGEPSAKLARTALQARATDELRRELALPNAPVAARGSEVILPLVADDAVLGYRIAVPMQIDGGADGKYLAYVDPATGKALAVQQLNLYAQGKLLYKGVDRYPARGRVDKPAPRVFVHLGGQPQTTGSDGSVTWSPDVQQTLTTAVVGSLVTIVNKAASGVLVTNDMPINPGASVVWDASARIEDDAQVLTYLSANEVKEFVRTNLDPAMPKLDEPITANVNIPQSCNAFFDGESINFFAASDRCENTGVIQDVVYHEFGHAVHTQEIVQGVGTFDGAMSEGAADFLAVSMTGDHGMGRGFLKNDDPLRDLENQAMWPRDVMEIHTTGLIFGGTFWDLRKALVAKYGQGPGAAKTLKLYLGALRRATSIPTSMIEVLVEDDDNGNLEDGTPNECAIREAYGRHGMRTATGTIVAPGILAQGPASATVRVDLSSLSRRCSVDTIDHVTLDWKPSFTGMPEAGGVQMTHVTGGDSYTGQLPLPASEVMYYTVTVTFADGSTMTLPDNLGDPSYQLYQGKTVPLYCTNFDDGNPFEHGWSTGAGDGQENPWVWGDAGAGGGTDPPVAFSGTKILQMAPGGEYQPNTTSFVQLPALDVGQYSDVRLQYRRWLAVEDSHYDKARVTVNGRQAWINYTANIGDASSTHHIDREWRFHDVRLSGYAYGHVLQIGWDLSSDEGLQLGGWALDDVCVVANVNSICGDGVKSPTEGCDAGPANSDAPNSPCRTYCRPPSCGDSILDTGEQCDEGPDGSVRCSDKCEILDDLGGGGCCGASRGDAAPFGFAALGFGLLVVRRRRRT